LLPLGDLFAPKCPRGAATAPAPERFAETECWRVTAPTTFRVDGKLAAKSYYFETANGRLIGTDGQTQSRLVFGGEQKLAGMTLPRTITRFRVEDGQEHVLTITAAEWLDPPADLFAMPDEIKRLLRTPEQLAEDTADLNKRFGH